jgi:putative FmdB family regulatory protein
MPTYEYECAKCKKSFEVFQSMKDAPLSICPKDSCRQRAWGKGKVKRLLGTGAGLIFKGSGFYITDYRSEGYKAAASKDSGSNGGTSTEKAAPEKTPKPAATEKPKPAAAEKSTASGKAKAE